MFTGLASFPLTTFDTSGELELESFATHLLQQLDAAPDAIFVACGTGELPSLDVHEHKLVAEIAAEIAAGTLPVFVGAGGGARIARAQYSAARESGVDGVLVLPPYLFEAGATGLIDYLHYVSSGGTMPTIVYQRANAIYTPDAVRALLDLPWVVGLKDGIGDVEHLTQLVSSVRASGHPRADSFMFLNGLPTAELSAPAYWGIGVKTYSSAVHCFAPDVARAFYNALRADDHASVERLCDVFYAPFGRLRSRVPGYAVSLVKGAARTVAGLSVGQVRPPLVEAAEEDLAALAVLVKQARQVIGG